MAESIPILDLKAAFDPATRDDFLHELRHTMINVGFFLLVNFEEHGPSKADFAEIKEEAVKFFALPEHVKKDIEMIKLPHFLGYSRLANEITAKQTDWREQIDIGTELPAPKEGEPLYKQIEGPNLWPDENYAPNFRPVIESYQKKMVALGTVVRRLVSEAIGLAPTALDVYFKPNQQNKMKLIAYPDVSQLLDAKLQALEDTPQSGQGVGPHRDSDLITFIYQATPHRNSLQVQTFKGDWVTIDNVPGSLVVNGGQTLEAVTNGVCKASIHRVTIPDAGSGTRISIPFFQTIDLDSRKSAVDDIPEEVLRLKEERDRLIERWGVDVGFQYTPDLAAHPVGYSVFRNRIKAHQDVAAKWYPEILKEVLTEY